MNIIDAHLPDYLGIIRGLFREYARSLTIDLCFQNFEQELAGLPGQYAPPSGRLLLAVCGQTPAGCVALRKIDDGTCEMKRLYVPPSFRGEGTGRLLARAAVEAARRIGYKRMRLDTLAEMKPAIALYESLGFNRTPAYYSNPVPQAVFMEMELA